MTFGCLIQAGPTRLTGSCCRPARNQTASNRWVPKRVMNLLSTLKCRVILIGLFLALFCFSPLAGATRPFDPPLCARSNYNFNSGWKLLVGDPKGAETPAFDDSAWKKVTLPHAWNEDAAFKVSIHDLPTGVAWYRKKFRLPAGTTDKKVFLEFEGIRQGGEFFLNGELIGRHE